MANANVTRNLVEDRMLATIMADQIRIARL